MPARKNALVDVFADEDGFQAVFSARAHLRECLQALDNLLPDLKSLLGMDRLEYKSVQNQGDFLIEVRKGHKGVPKDWELVCSTKQVDRFLPPAVKSARLALDVAKEKLQLEAERGEGVFHVIPQSCFISGLAMLDREISRCLQVGRIFCLRLPSTSLSFGNLLKRWRNSMLCSLSLK